MFTGFCETNKHPKPVPLDHVASVYRNYKSIAANHEGHLRVKLSMMPHQEAARMLNIPLIVKQLLY